MQINFSKGFSLAELLVSISIFSLMMTVAVFSYRESSDRLALNAAAQEVAIVLREAQVYALSVKEDTVGSGSFSYGYGVYFNPVVGTENYYLFIDKDSTNTYLHGSGCGGTPTECVTKYTLRDGVRIQSVCNALAECYSTGQTALHIKFKRPSPSAILTFIDSAGNPTWSTTVSSIVLVSPQGRKATIVVSRTGSVQIQ